jgi:hypothetical protein
MRFCHRVRRVGAGLAAGPAAFQRFLEHARHSQLLLAAGAALLTGASIWIRHPIPLDDPVLEIVRQRAPRTHAIFLGSCRLFMFTTPLIAYSAALSFFFVRLYPARDSESAGALPRIEPPEKREQLYIVLGEFHHPTERRRVASPRWISMPEKGLYTGIACFGAIGSGKTASFIRPVALQLLSFAADDPARRLGGLVLEVKGDFCEQVRDMLRAAGRGEDYVEISLTTRFRYNPLANRSLSEDALAYAITTLISNIYGKGKDPFWPMASTNAMKFFILLHRLLDDYVTLIDVYRTAISPAQLQERLRLAAAKYHLVEYVEVPPDAFTAHIGQLGSHKFAQVAQGGPWRAETTFELLDVLKKHNIVHNPITRRADVLDVVAISQEAFTEHAADLVEFQKAAAGDYRADATHDVVERLKQLRIPFRTLTVDKAAGDTDPVLQDQMEAVLRWFRGDWTQIDVKLRTSIVEGISVFLSLFDTNPPVKRIFCPPKETFDPEQNPPEQGYPLGEPFPFFADLIERGKVVALNFPVSLDPTVAKTIGTLMKLDYQRAVLLRIPKMAAAQAAERAGGPHVHFRPTVFCVDEYQNFATVGETGTGDQNFFSLSRQPRCIAIVATQSVVSLKSALSSDDAYKTLLQTFRTKLFLNTADDTTAEFAMKLCGKEDRLQTSYNVSESSQDAKVSFLDGRTAGGKTSVSTSKSYQVRQLDRFPQAAFYGLKTAQSIALVFDGVNPIPPTYLYLKPYWLPMELSWWDQYERGLLS